MRKVRRSLGRQRERLLDAYLAGAIDLATFEKRRQGLTDRDDELAAREREILAQGQRLLDTAALLHSMTDVCVHHGSHWPQERDPDEKRHSSTP